MNILVLGHSQIASLRRAWGAESSPHDGAHLSFLALRSAEFLQGSGGRNNSVSEIAEQDREAILGDFRDQAERINVVALCLNGQQHHALGLLQPAGVPQAGKGDRLEKRLFERVHTSYVEWLEFLRPNFSGPMIAIPPPPPVDSEEWIRQNPGAFAARLQTGTLNPPEIRLSYWKTQCRAIAEACARFGVDVLELPAGIFAENGFLAERCRGRDPAHGNVEYGQQVLGSLLHFATSCAPQEHPRHIDRALAHPYQHLPDHAFWKQAVASIPKASFDPVVSPPFMIATQDRVATAGSCFAQHISKRLRSAGFQFLVTEQVSARAPEGEEGAQYDFSARYGNVYTARQLGQLFDRAFEFYEPIDVAWERHGGGLCDPFRPRIEPAGFTSIDALLEDRRKHFAAVREMFSKLDVFIFTLGLTEAWFSRLDGAVFPVAPGVVGGKFDQQKYAFANFSVDDVVGDLRNFIEKLRLINRDARVILTVSPVPLVATYEARHVLVSTTYSKSVLRVSAEVVAKSFPGVYYFPSYEIITGNHARGSYFGPDLRSVTEEGVDHVMSVFMRRLTAKTPGSAQQSEDANLDKELREMEALAQADCDEELLARP